MLTEYKWSREVEAVARAIAAADGWQFTDDTYSLFATPVGRPWHYWCHAVAAIDAYKSALLIQEVR